MIKYFNTSRSISYCIYWSSFEKRGASCIDFRLDSTIQNLIQAERYFRSVVLFPRSLAVKLFPLRPGDTRLSKFVLLYKSLEKICLRQILCLLIVGAMKTANYLLTTNCQWRIFKFSRTWAWGFGLNVNLGAIIVVSWVSRVLIVIKYPEVQIFCPHRLLVA